MAKKKGTKKPKPTKPATQSGEGTNPPPPPKPPGGNG